MEQLAESCAAAPDKSLPKATGSKRALRGAYHFLSTDVVTAAAIMQPHQQQTGERIAHEGIALVLHDTTSFVFNGKRQGLGPVHGGKTDRGFLTHCSLAVTADGTRRPLGVLASTSWARPETPRKKPRGTKLAGSEYAKLTDKESERWFRHVRQTHERVGPSTTLLHIMDREADIYTLLADMITAGNRFVIRMCQDRVAREVEGQEWQTLRTVAERAPISIAIDDVPISKRAGSAIPGVRKIFASRTQRRANLAVSATPIHFKKPRYLHDKPASLALNLVRVYEVDAPDEVEPIEWILLTTEPIETTANVQFIVESYRTRWLIEEYFKALKTGCEIEKLQIETFHGLENAVALYMPIAWNILLLRNLAQHQPDAPAERVLSPTQIQVLTQISPKKLNQGPTVAEVMLAIAMLGGYIKHKRGPGWLVLSRGMQDLLLLERGWLARERVRKDVVDH